MSINYANRLQDLGAAINTLQAFARDYDLSEGAKARINHAAAGILENLSEADRAAVLAETDYRLAHRG